MKRAKFFLLLLFTLIFAQSSLAYINEQEYKSELPPVMIQGAMPIETDILISSVENPEIYKLNGWEYVSGKFGGYPVVVCTTKIGAVSSAVSTALGIEFFRPIAVINQGTAGGHDPNLHRYDIVIMNDCYNSSAWISGKQSKGEGVNYRDINLWDEKDFAEVWDKNVFTSSDKNLFDTALNARDKYSYTRGKITTGRIATGEAWENRIDMILFLHEKFGSSVEEMETDSVCQVCKVYGVPFLGVRILSNSAVNNEDFDVNTASECQKFVLEILREYINTKNSP